MIRKVSVTFNLNCPKCKSISTYNYGYYEPKLRNEEKLSLYCRVCNNLVEGFISLGGSGPPHGHLVDK